MFEGDFSLEDVKALIITLNVDPTEAVNAITGFLRDNYGKDKKAAVLCGGINGNISKKMNYYIDGDLWFIRVRKEKELLFVENDFVTIDLDVSKMGTNKVVFSIETMKKRISKVKICPMHENRLNTKVRSNPNS